MKHMNQEGFISKLLLFVVIVIVLVLLTFLFLHKRTSLLNTAHTSVGNAAAIAAGKELSNNTCNGSGPVTFSHLPMDATDVSSIIPYGTMVAQHVTPIDHQYYSPADLTSARDSYNVYALADGHITTIEHRTSDFSNFQHGQATDEYRIVIAYSCTFFSYYDLLTSLSPDIRAQLGNNLFAKVNIPITAGEVIGKIGGQTLDFAVWDTAHPLKGFIVPGHYDAEPWKIYTADPLQYATPTVRAAMLSLYTRKTDPVSGKIDFDMDGRLSGNWFLKSQGSLFGPSKSGQIGYKGDLSFARNNYDPTLWEISSGAIGDNGSQFAIGSAAIAPDTVSVSSGIVKYDLYHIQLYVDGAEYDPRVPIKGNDTVTASAAGSPLGCLVVQLVSSRELKTEYIAAACSQTLVFDSYATDYIR